MLYIRNTTAPRRQRKARSAGVLFVYRHCAACGCCVVSAADFLPRGTRAQAATRARERLSFGAWLECRAHFRKRRLGWPWVVAAGVERVTALEPHKRRTASKGGTARAASGKKKKRTVARAPGFVLLTCVCSAREPLHVFVCLRGARTRCAVLLLLLKECAKPRRDPWQKASVTERVTYTVLAVRHARQRASRDARLGLRRKRGQTAAHARTRPENGGREDSLQRSATVPEAAA